MADDDLDLLLELEWSASQWGEGEPACGICGGLKCEGHHAGCQLAERLGRDPMTPQAPPAPTTRAASGGGALAKLIREARRA